MLVSSVMPVTIASGLGKVSGLAVDSKDKVIYYLDYAKNSLMKITPGKEPETMVTDLNSPRQLIYRPQSRFAFSNSLKLFVIRCRPAARLRLLLKKVMKLQWGSRRDTRLVSFASVY